MSGDDDSLVRILAEDGSDVSYDGSRFEFGFSGVNIKPDNGFVHEAYNLFGGFPLGFDDGVVARCERDGSVADLNLYEGRRRGRRFFFVVPLYSDFESESPREDVIDRVGGNESFIGLHEVVFAVVCLGVRLLPSEVFLRIVIEVDAVDLEIESAEQVNLLRDRYC